MTRPRLLGATLSATILSESDFHLGNLDLYIFALCTHEKHTMKNIALVPLAALLAVALSGAQQWIEVPIPEVPTWTYFYHDSFRTNTIDIPLMAEDGALEYKLKMKEGDSVVFSWEVMGFDNPEWFYSEFHGHTEPVPGEPGTVTFYRKETGVTQNGTFIAPFDGIHGWFLQNQGVNPVVVRLRLAGFYEVIPDQLPQQ